MKSSAPVSAPAGTAMRKSKSRAIRVALLLAVIFPLCENEAAAEFTSWINRTVGNWSVASNWNNGVPNSGKDAYVFAGIALLNIDSYPVGVAAEASYLGIGIPNFSNINGAGTFELSGAGVVLKFGSLGVPDYGAGTGTLNISSGGEGKIVKLSASRFPSEFTPIGREAGSNGTVNVRNPSSKLWLHNLVVGQSGTGALTISNGGTAYCLADSVIGWLAGSSGTVTVTGAGSAWVAGYDGVFVSGGFLQVGGTGTTSGGTARLNILDGGIVGTGFLKVFNTGLVVVDNGSSTNVGLFVGGGAIQPPTEGGTLGDVLVGNNADGRMEVSNGGTLRTHRGHVGYNNRQGAVLVDGPGTTWIANGSFFIGVSGGTGFFDVTNGALASTAGNAYLGYSAAPATSGGYGSVSGAGARLSVAVNLFVGGNGAGPGGSGLLLIGNGGTVSAATTTIYNTGTLDLSGNALLTGPLTVLGGTIRAAGNGSFPSDFTIGSQGAYAYCSSGYNLTLGGVISGSGALVKQAVSFVTGPGNLILTGASTYTGPTTVAGGKLIVDGSITSATSVNSGGTLGGRGTVASVTVASGGTLAPGNSVGRLSVAGIYTQATGGKLDIELGGYTPGTEYDQLAVSGSATIAGTLKVSLVSSFRPKVGDTFTILTCGSESGNFSAITSTGFTVRSDASPQGIILTVLTVDPVLPPYVVTNTNNTGPGSLRQTLADVALVAGAQTITFHPALNGGSIVLDSEIVVNDVGGVAVDATALTAGLTITGSGTNRLFYLTGDADLTLRGLTLTGGNGGGSGFSASGGAIYNTGTLTLERCTFTGNATSFGGAIFSYPANITDPGTSSTTLTQCTLAGNTATTRGGAILNYNGRTTLTHCTLSGNTAPASSGGGIASFGDNLTATVVRNSLIAGNASSDVDFFNGATNSFASLGGNLTGSGNATGTFNQPGDTTGQTIATIKLAPLGSYGGPTRTMALITGSPARNAATLLIPAISADQRGFPMVGTPDIGAYEAGTFSNFNAFIYESLPANATLAQHAAGFDFDGDGRSNQDEWIALTDPTSGASLFAATVLRNGANLEITARSATGRTYTLMQSDTLLGGSWTATPGFAPLAGTGNPLTFPIPFPATNHRFYQVRVTVP